MKLRHVLLAASLLILAPLAMAKAPAPVRPSNIENNPIYVDLTLGASTDFQHSPAFVNAHPLASFQRYHFGVAADMGYMFNDNLGVEIGGARLPGAKLDYAGLAGYQNVNYIIDVAAKAVAPLGGGFSVFGKLGPAVVITNEDVGVFNVAFPARTNVAIAAFGGAGVSYDMTDELSANIQVMGVSNSRGSVDLNAATNSNAFKETPPVMMFGAGLSYRFSQ